MSEIFKQSFQNSSWLHIHDWPVNFRTLNLNQTFSLETLFSGVEILLTLRNVDGDKTPSPGGFPLKFTQSFWHLFREA